jgi:hypothetical protein
MPCHWFGVSQCFEGMQCLHLQQSEVPPKKNVFLKVLSKHQETQTSQWSITPEKTAVKTSNLDW